MMHDSSVIYPNYLKLYRENYATGKLEFAVSEQAFLRYITWNLAVIFRLNRDDTHLTSMKILQFSIPPPPVYLRPKFFHPLDLERPISSEAPLCK